MMHDFRPHLNGPDLSGEADAAELAEVWDLLSEASPVGSPVGRVDEAWERLSIRLGEAEVRSTRASHSTVRATWLRLAASIAVFLVGGFGVWNGVPASVEAGHGDRVEVVLPGGSRVELNAGSTLRWSRGFSWLPGLDRAERVVRLDGEAFFDVARDGRPFRVETSDAQVAVLGTRFNVRARPGEGTSVMVDEGSVEVSDRAEGSVVLVAGQMVVAGAGAFEVVDGAVTEAQAWRAGGFAVADARLESILAELERRFSTQIDASTLDRSVRDRRLTLYYSSPMRLDGILDDVATALGLRYREIAGGWEVVPSP
jgi:ferric-dicitrate binding protein FerR (iron transport regulator)